jgi:hypothetical protein
VWDVIFAYLFGTLVLSRVSWTTNDLEGLQASIEKP